MNAVGRTGLAGCALAVCAVLFAGLGAGPALADADDLIETVRINDGELVVTLAETELPVDVDPADAVVLQLDGDDVPVRVDEVARVADRSTDLRTVVLVLDTSGSMLGQGIADARTAAARLLTDLPPDVQVGLVTFDDEVAPLVAPTRDRAVVQTALAGLAASGNTKLYDAVPVALQMAGQTGQRRLMVLSDGRDDGSTLGVAEAVAAISAAGATVDVVDTSADGSAAGGLQPLAQAGGGRAVSVSGAQAADVFSEIARTYAVQLVLTTALPAGSGERELTLRVQLDGAAGVLVDDWLLRPDAPAAAVTAAELPPKTTSFWLMLAAVFLAVLLFLLLAVLGGDSRAGNERKTRKVLSTYTFRPDAPARGTEGSRLRDTQLTQSALGFAQRTVERRGSGADLTLAIDRAGLSWRPNEWLVLWTASTVVGALLGSLLLGGGLLAGLFGGLLGWLGPRSYLRMRARSRQKAFLAALPDALQLAASSLSSGYSLAQALDALVQEGSQPMAGEMGRALAEVRIGRDLEDALDAVGDRMECEDFRWVVMAVRVQRQVGGNLAEVLSRVCTTMRERAALRRQVSALSAEGRLSAYILLGLPVALGLFMFTFRRDYFRPMYTETVGILALAVTAVFMTLGAVWMNKLVKVEM